MPPKKTESAAGATAHAAPAAATGASTKARAAPSHPPYQAMITDAILTLRDRNGSSRQSLKKFVRANNNITVGDKMFDSLFNKALKMGVEKGHFTQPKGASGGTKLAKKQAEPKKPAPKKDKEGAPAKKPAKKAAPKEKKAAAAKGEKGEKGEKKTTKKAAAPKKAAPKEKKAAAPKAEKADKSEKSESLTKTKTGRVAKAAKPAAAKKAAPKKAAPKKAAAAAATTAAASAEKK